MTGTYVPVNGDTRSDGSLLALQGLVSDSSLLVPPPVAAGQFEGDSVQVSAYSVTAELLASAGFAGLAVSGQSNVVYFVIDVMPTMDVPSTDPNGPVATWVYGVGVRIGVRGISVEGTAATSVLGLAASATLNGTATTFQFDAIGVGIGIMPLLTGLVDQSLTGFDVGTIQEIGNVLNSLIGYLADPDNFSQLTPQVVGVIFSTGDVVQAPAASYGWALRGIQAGLSQSELQGKTVKPLPKGVTLDQAIIGAVYQDVVGSSSSAPTDPQKAVARQLLHSGP